MTRKFDVIKVDDYGVVVDKEVKLQVDDNYYNVSINEFGRVLETTFSQIRYEEEHGVIRYKLVASIGKRVKMWHGEVLPLIELSEKQDKFIPELVERMRAMAWSENSGFYNAYAQELEDWYKAQSKGMYSEEDVRVAIEMARQKDFEQDHYNMRTYSSEKYTSDQILNSLQKNKLPVAVLLDMETYNPPEEQYLGVHKHLRVKLTDPETNTIKPINVFL